MPCDDEVYPYEDPWVRYTLQLQEPWLGTFTVSQHSLTVSTTAGNWAVASIEAQGGDTMTFYAEDVGGMPPSGILVGPDGEYVATVPVSDHRTTVEALSSGTYRLWIGPVEKAESRATLIGRLG